MSSLPPASTDPEEKEPALKRREFSVDNHNSFAYHLETDTVAPLYCQLLTHTPIDRHSHNTVNHIAEILDMMALELQSDNRNQYKAIDQFYSLLVTQLIPFDLLLANILDSGLIPLLVTQLTSAHTKIPRKMEVTYLISGLISFSLSENSQLFWISDDVLCALLNQLDLKSPALIQSTLHCFYDLALSNSYNKNLLLSHNIIPLLQPILLSRLGSDLVHQTNTSRIFRNLFVDNTNPNPFYYKMALLLVRNTLHIHTDHGINSTILWCLEAILSSLVPASPTSKTTIDLVMRLGIMNYITRLLRSTTPLPMNLFEPLIRCYGRISSLTDTHFYDEVLLPVFYTCLHYEDCILQFVLHILTSAASYHPSQRYLFTRHMQFILQLLDDPARILNPHVRQDALLYIKVFTQDTQQ